jgi:hypothetical protein
MLPERAFFEQHFKEYFISARPAFSDSRAAPDEPTRNPDRKLPQMAWHTKADRRCLSDWF